VGAILRAAGGVHCDSRQDEGKLGRFIDAEPTIEEIVGQLPL
jgi:hypothetical protein